MNQFLVENERRTNRILLNFYWISAYLSYLSLFNGRVLNHNTYQIGNLITGVIITVILGVTIEFLYYYINKTNKLKTFFKYYITFIIFIVSVYIICITKNPLMSILYFYPIIAAAAYYDVALIISIVIIDVISIIIQNIGVGFNAEGKISSYIHIFLCAVFIICFMIKSKNVIAKYKNLQNKNKS